VGESVRGTWQFLLHRPAPRDEVLGAKLLTGGAATLLLAALPLLLYALWAATPGTHASPFEWRFTFPTWLQTIQLPLPYLGAYLSGLRPGRWFGTRLLPLACGMAIWFMLSVIPLSWWVALPLTLALEAVFVILILYVGSERDFS
jgi:ABC-type transport system involved in multi-copper enzyme maturation permease subunit